MFLVVMEVILGEDIPGADSQQLCGIVPRVLDPDLCGVCPDVSGWSVTVCARPLLLTRRPAYRLGGLCQLAEHFISP